MGLSISAPPSTWEPAPGTSQTSILRILLHRENTPPSPYIHTPQIKSFHCSMMSQILMSIDFWWMQNDPLDFWKFWFFWARSSIQKCIYYNFIFILFFLTIFSHLLGKWIFRIWRKNECGKTPQMWWFYSPGHEFFMWAMQELTDLEPWWKITARQTKKSGIWE